jgi:hypothetical protein
MTDKIYLKRGEHCVDDHGTHQWRNEGRGGGDHAQCMRCMKWAYLGMGIVPPGCDKCPTNYCENGELWDYNSHGPNLFDGYCSCECHPDYPWER